MTGFTRVVAEPPISCLKHMPNCVMLLMAFLSVMAIHHTQFLLLSGLNCVLPEDESMMFMIQLTSYIYVCKNDMHSKFLIHESWIRSFW